MNDSQINSEISLESIQDTNLPQSDESGKIVSLQARIAELEDAFNVQQEYTIEVETERDELRGNNSAMYTRIQELETAFGEQVALATVYYKDRDQKIAEIIAKDMDIEGLRKKLDELEAEEEDDHKYIKRLESMLGEKVAELAELKQPRLIKQTLQAIYEDGRLGYERDYKQPKASTLVYLRRDTFRNPDGTEFVKCELEPIETETEK